MFNIGDYFDELVEDLDDIIAPDDKVGHFAAGMGIGLAIVAIFLAT